jgi:CheY-like chemotaxis protein
MSIKVLIVDDQIIDAMLTMKAMDDCGHAHKFVSAGDGHEAFRLMHGNKFDVILLDIKMPRVDGFELLQRLRDERMRTAPVFIVSGSNLQVDRTRATALGAIEYVHKAMEYSEFKHNLQTALARHNFC